MPRYKDIPDDSNLFAKGLIRALAISLLLWATAAVFIF